MLKVREKKIKIAPFKLCIRHSIEENNSGLFNRSSVAGLMVLENDAVSVPKWNCCIKVIRLIGRRL